MRFQYGILEPPQTPMSFLAWFWEIGYEWESWLPLGLMPL